MRASVRTLRRWARSVRPRGLPGTDRSGPALRERHVAEWAIAIHSGEDLTSLRPRQPCPVLTHRDVSDVPADFVADPFMVRRDERWFMFFELFNLASGRGEVGLATSADLTTWSYERVVLAEPFHLSYPYVFEWEGECYMLPEASEAGVVRLYRADPFPWRWTPAADLLTGGAFFDASIVRHEDRWWLFAGTGGPPRYAESLLLYHADALEGPWHAHPGSPVVASDQVLSRPAGRPVRRNGRLVRFAQDCSRTYGWSVWALEVLRLDLDGYAERPLREDPILQGGGERWNRNGMHHVDPHRLADGGWVACVDGQRWREGLG